VLSEKIGFKARDYILRVMNGDRNLSHTGIYSLSKALKFNSKERLYFEHLVMFNQARTSDEKNQHFQILIDLRKGSVDEKILEEQYEYFSHYHNVALRSLLPVIEFNDDYEKIGKFFDPPITPKQIRQSIDLLLRLGMLLKDSDGKYQTSSPLISTGDEVTQTGLVAFHKACLQLASRSLDLHPAKKRDVSGVTLSISERGFEQIKEEISLFRKKIMSIAKEDSNESAVYQLSLQLFPLTRIKNNDEK
jgi:uncharacterized protein (TIGR02147 family)